MLGLVAGLLLHGLLLHGVEALAAPAGKEPAPRALSERAPPSLPALLARVARQEGPPASHTPWKRLRLPDARDVILGRTAVSPGAAAARLDVSSAERRLAQAYGLPRAAASAFLRAQLMLEPPEGWFMPLPPAQRAQSLQAHREALRAAPGSLALAASLVAARALAGPPEYEDTVLEALDTAPDPAALALQLVPARFAACEPRLAAYAVSRRPEVLQRALEACGLTSDDELATAFYLAAFRQLTSQPGAPFPAELGERLVRNLFTLQRPSLALQVLGRLPPAQQQSLLQGEWRTHTPEHDSGVATERTRIDAADVRLDIALANLVEGRREEARRWFEGHRSHPPKPAGEDHARDGEPLKVALLARSLAAPPAADPFELLLIPGGASMPGTSAAVVLAQALAPRFPARARRQLEWLLSARKEPREEAAAGARFDARLTFLAPARGELARADARETARLEAAHAGLPAVAPGANGDAQTARIAAQLATPPLQVFAEKALTPAPAPARAWRRLDPRSLELPRGFWAVRAERRGQRVAVAALSQRLDPTGELSGGAYWLLLSEDGGTRWGAPLYTGLRHLRPYELEKVSAVPMLEGETVRLAASVRELDDESISFPPVALRPKREVKALLLEAGLGALRRDADGDGLTDLVEDRLLLSPAAADTDGDGVRDGADALPQVASGEGSTDAVPELVAQLLFELSVEGAQPRGLVTGLPQDGGMAALPEGPAPTSLEDLRWLAMDRALLTRVRTSAPTLALGDAELEAAGKRFGAFSPMSIEVFVNQAGDQALLEFSEGWRGGTYLARRVEGRWVLESRGFWVT
jgi:hypothetical protein